MPEPGEWLAVAGDVDVTVVDVGWDALETLHDPSEAVTAWLRLTDTSVYPVVTTTATGPSTARLEAALQGLQTIREAQAPLVEAGHGMGESTVLVSQTDKDTKTGFAQLAADKPLTDNLLAQHRVGYMPASAEVRISGVPDRFPEPLLSAATDTLHFSGAISPGKAAA